MNCRLANARRLALLLTIAASAAPVAPVALAAAAPPGDQVSVGPPGGSASGVVVHPNDPERLLVATPDGMVLTTDGGLGFTSSGTGLPVALPLRELTPDPKDPDTVYVLAGFQLFRTTDFGASWTQVPHPGLYGPVDVAVASAGNGLLVADTTQVWLSSDGGATWAITLAENFTRAVAYAPNDPSLAYAGVGNGLWRSTDGGSTWSASPGFAPFSFVDELIVLPDAANTLFLSRSGGAAVLRSTDGGTSFTDVSGGLPTPPEVELFAWDAASSTLWLGLEENGIRFTDDLGATWNAVNFGLPSKPGVPTGLAFASDGDVFQTAQSTAVASTSLLKAGNGGLWRIPGGLPPWQHLAFPERCVADVLVAGPGGLRAAAAADGVHAGAPGAQLAPTSWTGFEFHDTSQVAVDPFDPTRWVAGSSGVVTPPFGGFPSPTVRLGLITGSGTTSQVTYFNDVPGDVGDLAFSPDVPGLVLASVSQFYPASVVLRSTDGGASWTGAAGTSGIFATALAFDPHLPGRVLLLTGANEWAESLDGGASWGPLQPAWPAAGSGVLLAFAPVEPDVLYRGDDGTGLQRSDDGGASWQPLGVGLQSLSDLEPHPELPGLFWVGDDGGAVLLSADGGASFAPVFDALPGDATGLAFDPALNALLIGTTETSAWELPEASPHAVLGPGTPGSGGFVPRHFGTGGLPQAGNAAWGLGGDRTLGGAAVVLGLSASEAALPLFGGTLFAGLPLALELGLVAGGTPGAAGDGSFSQAIGIPASAALVGATVVSQYGVVEPSPFAVVLSDGLATTVMP